VGLVALAQSGLFHADVSVARGRAGRRLVVLGPALAIAASAGVCPLAAHGAVGLSLHGRALSAPVLTRSDTFVVVRPRPGATPRLLRIDGRGHIKTLTGFAPVLRGFARASRSTTDGQVLVAASPERVAVLVNRAKCGEAESGGFCNTLFDEVATQALSGGPVERLSTCRHPSPYFVPTDTEVAVAEQTVAVDGEDCSGNGGQVAAYGLGARRSRAVLAGVDQSLSSGGRYLVWGARSGPDRAVVYDTRSRRTMVRPFPVQGLSRVAIQADGKVAASIGTAAPSPMCGEQVGWFDPGGTTFHPLSLPCESGSNVLYLGADRIAFDDHGATTLPLEAASLTGGQITGLWPHPLAPDYGIDLADNRFAAVLRGCKIDRLVVTRVTAAKDLRPTRCR